jgi:hypothetical protein
MALRLVLCSLCFRHVGLACSSFSLGDLFLFFLFGHSFFLSYHVHLAATLSYWTCGVVGALVVYVLPLPRG